MGKKRRDTVEVAGFQMSSVRSIEKASQKAQNKYEKIILNKRKKRRHR